MVINVLFCTPNENGQGLDDALTLIIETKFFNNNNESL